MESKKVPNSQKKRSDLWLPEVEGMGKEEEWKGDQKVQTSSFKMNAYLDVTYNVMTITNIAVWYIGKLLRE